MESHSLHWGHNVVLALVRPHVHASEPHDGLAGHAVAQRAERAENSIASQAFDIADTADHAADHVCLGGRRSTLGRERAEWVGCA